MKCTKCGSPLMPDVNFCPVCGKNARSGVKVEAPESPPSPAGIASNLKDLDSGEVVLMDTGLFPITYVKNSVNGKLYLTNSRLVFKAGKLQPVGGVSPLPGLFIPNPRDAEKSKRYFALPLSEITVVERGWTSLTIQTVTGKYEFRGMRKTKEWQEAINKASTRTT